MPSNTNKNINTNEIPLVKSNEVYSKILAAKKPNSSVPGDIPKRIIQEFSRDLVQPLTILINSSLKHLEYPNSWKLEYATPIGKITHPESNSDLRLISLTKFFSKVFEKFIVEWIFFIIGHKLDPGQFGGLPGNSISHYLIHLVNFILSNLDSRSPTGILAAIVDFAQAFNRMSHNRIITIMSQMGFPGWLLKLMFSYFERRKMYVRFKGATSSEQAQFAQIGIFCHF